MCSDASTDIINAIISSVILRKLHHDDTSSAINRVYISFQKCYVLSCQLLLLCIILPIIIVFFTIIRFIVNLFNTVSKLYAFI
jgi:hypothetical protein